MSRVAGYSTSYLEGNKLVVGPITKGFIKKTEKGNVAAIETSNETKVLFMSFFELDKLYTLKYRDIEGYIKLSSRGNRNPSLKFNTAVDGNNKLLWQFFREDYLGLFEKSGMEFEEFIKHIEFIFTKHSNFYEIEIKLNCIEDLKYNKIDFKEEFLLKLNSAMGIKNDPFDVNIESDESRDQIQQAKFRQDLIDEANALEIEGCWLCGREVESLLDAAHIIEHCDGGSFDINNGLLLCKNHHAQFDKGLMKINASDGKVFYNGDIETIKQIHEDISLDSRLLNETRKMNLLRK